MTDADRARRIAKAVLLHATPWYVAGTAHAQERVLQEATKTVLRELQTPNEIHEHPVLPPQPDPTDET